MNRTLLGTGCMILCIAALILAGCTGDGREKTPVTPTATPVKTLVPADHPVVDEAQDKTTVGVAPGAIITVNLQENPTTGFRWTMNVTPGLTVTSDVYTPSDTTGTMVGSGGTRTWEITATGSGTQQIRAIYNRSWEPLSGSEETFTLTVIVR